MLDKNLPRKGRRRTFAIRLLLDFAALLKSLSSFSGDQAWAVAKAYRDYLRLRSTNTKADVMLDRPGADVYPSYHGSVVADYFLRNRKMFSSLPANKFRLGQ